MDVTISKEEYQELKQQARMCNLYKDVLIDAVTIERNGLNEISKVKVNIDKVLPATVIRELKEKEMPVHIETVLVTPPIDTITNENCNSNNQITLYIPLEEAMKLNNKSKGLHIVAKTVGMTFLY